MEATTPQEQTSQRENTGKYLILAQTSDDTWRELGVYDKKQGDVRKQAVKENAGLREAVEGEQPVALVAVPVSNWKPMRPKTRVRETLTFE